MYKPILQRKKPVPIHQTREQWSAGDLEPSLWDSLGSEMIVPGTLLTNYWQKFFVPKKTLWSPLNSRKYSYPPAVEQMLRQAQSASEIPLKDVKSEISMNCGTFWCFRSNKLIIWEYQGCKGPDVEQYLHPQLMTISLFDMPISAMAIAEVGRITQMLPGRNKIAAIAFGHSIQLFKLDSNKLQPFNIVIKSASKCITRINIETSDKEQRESLYSDLDVRQFSLCNILFSDSAGNVGVYDLLKGKKYQHGRLYRSTIGKIVREQTHSQVVQMVCTRAKQHKTDLNIYCLIRHYGHRSLVLKFIESMLGFNLSRDRNSVCSVIYIFTKDQNYLRYSHSLTDDSIAKKVRQSYQQFFSKEASSQQKNQRLKIHSIQQSQRDLRIIFEQGMSVVIREYGYSGFVGSVVKQPSPPELTGVGTELKQQSTPTNRLVYRAEGARIADNAVIVHENSRQYHSKKVEEEQVLGFISISDRQIRNTFQKDKKWLLFNKNSLVVFSQLRQVDIILIYAHVYCQLKSNDQLTYECNIRIHQKLDTFIVAWGNTQFIVRIIQLLTMKKTYQIQIDSDNYNLVLLEITGKVKIREERARTIRISSMCESYLEYLMYRFKEDKLLRTHQSINETSDCIWHALTVIFSENLAPIRFKQPRFFAQNPTLVYQIKERFQLLEPIIKRIKSHYDDISAKNLQKSSFEDRRARQWMMDQQINFELLSTVNSRLTNKKWQDQITKDNILSEAWRKQTVNSTQKLCFLLCKSIPKLKILIDIFINLAQCDKMLAGLPKFQNVLFDLKSRAKLAQRAVQVFKYNDEQLLDTIQQVLPQLRIKPVRAFQLWKSYFINPEVNAPVQEPTVHTMVSILNLQNYQQIKKYYMQDQKHQQFLFKVLLQKTNLLKREVMTLQQQEKAYRTEDHNQRVQHITLSFHLQEMIGEIDSYQHYIQANLQQILQHDLTAPKRLIKQQLQTLFTLINLHGSLNIKRQAQKLRQLYSPDKQQPVNIQSIQNNLKLQFVAQKINANRKF